MFGPDAHGVGARLGHGQLRHRHEVHARAAEKRRHEKVRRPLVELQGCSRLLQLPVVEQRQAVAHRHRLDLIVRDMVQSG